MVSEFLFFCSSLCLACYVKSVVMYISVKDINFVSFYDFLLDFGSVPIVWYLSFVTFLLVYIIKPVSSVLYIYVRTVGYLCLFIRMSIKTCQQGSLFFAICLKMIIVQHNSSLGRMFEYCRKKLQRM